MNKTKIDLDNDLILRSENIEYNNDTLKNKFDEQKDSGWITATLTSNFKLYKSDGVCRYRKIGKLVNIQANLSPASDDNTLNGGDYMILFTLPEEYRPSHGVESLCQGSYTNIFLTRIYTNGKVALGRYRDSASYSNTPPPNTAWLPINITYFVD